MIPCLYDVSETEYKTNGIGKLSDCVSCIVTEKRNGSFELEMKYPVDGIHVEELVQGNIILARPADNKPSQPFRIYEVTSDLSGTMKVEARHVSYQLNYITVSPTTVVTGTHDQVNAAFDALKKNVTTDCPFSFETDIESDAYFGILKPVSFRSALGGVDGSMLDTFGGEFEWDFYTVRLWKSRGKDNGVRIVYGKNLTEFKQEKNDENVITGVHPYWKDSQTGDVVELLDKVVTLDDSGLPYERIGLLDCSTEFEEEPTQDQLRSYAASYLGSTSYTEPSIDIDIDFEALWQTPEYADIVEAERVSLCDTVHVYVSTLGIEVSASVTETEYDVLLERYKSITLSNSPTSSRNSSISLTVATTSQVKSMIAMTDSSIRISVSNTYATKATLENNYSTTVETRSMIDLTAEDLTLSFNKKLSDDYSTTEEIQSMINLSAEGITLSFEEALSDYSTTSEVQSMITLSEEGITLSFEKTLSDYSTTTEVQSLIKASEDGISLTYVKSGEVRSQFALESNSITISSGTITLSGNRLVINASNLSLSSSGTLDCSNATVSGKLTATSGSYTMDMTAGSIRQYYNDSLYGMITPVGNLSSGGTNGYFTLAGSSSNAKAVSLGLGSASSVAGYIFVNNGGDPNDYSERVQLSGDLRITGAAHHSNVIYIGSNDNAEIYYGTYGNKTALWDYNSFYAEGDLGCGGTKYRVVDTEHYGKIGMNAYETASAMFGDSGGGVIGEGGQITVFFPTEFTEVIDMDADYQVFVTPVSAGSVSHIKKGNGFFTVYGEPGTEFDWMVSAHQRDYTMNRLETVTIEPQGEIPFDESVFYGDNAAEDAVLEMVDLYEQEVEQV